MRKDLERTSVIMMKVKNPSFSMERNVVDKTSMPMEKIKPKPIASISTPPSSRTIKKVSTAREKTQPELAKDYEFSKRARKSAPTFNEITTGVKLGVNKAAQKAASTTKVKVADKAREIFAPNTTVKRDYADPTRVNVGDGSKLGDKKTIQKLDKDGTVLKNKTKQVVSKKGNGDGKSGYISINTRKRSKFADEGVESFTNKKTRYRATKNKEGKDLVKTLGGIIVGFPLSVAGISHSAKKKARRANI